MVNFADPARPYTVNAVNLPTPGPTPSPGTPLKIPTGDGVYLKTFNASTSKWERASPLIKVEAQSPMGWVARQNGLEIISLRIEFLSNSSPYQGNLVIEAQKYALGANANAPPKLSYGARTLEKRIPMKIYVNGSGKIDRCYATSTGGGGVTQGSAKKYGTFYVKSSTPGVHIGSLSCDTAGHLAVACTGIANTSDTGYGRRAQMFLHSSFANTCVCGSTDPNEDGRVNLDCAQIQTTCLDPTDKAPGLDVRTVVATGAEFAYCAADEHVISCMGRASDDSGYARRAIMDLRPVRGTPDACRCWSTDPNENNRVTTHCQVVEAVCAKGFNDQDRLYQVSAGDSDRLYCNNAKDRMLSCNGTASWQVDSGSGGASFGAENKGRRALFHTEISSNDDNADFCRCRSTDPNEWGRISGCRTISALCERAAP